MQSARETILSVLPGPTDQTTTRAVVALRHTGDDTAIELRQESFSPAVGWFVQSRLDLSAEQVAGLRQTLGCVPAMCRKQNGGCESRPATLAFPTGDHAATA